MSGPLAGIELDRFMAGLSEFAIIPQVIIKAGTVLATQRKCRVEFTHLRDFCQRLVPTTAPAEKPHKRLARVKRSRIELQSPMEFLLRVCPIPVILPN